VSTPIFYVHVKGRGVRAEVRLNDAPVLDLFREYPQDAFPTVSEWVVDGENLLSVHIDDHDPSASLAIALCEAKLGDVPDPATQVPIAEIRWPPPRPAMPGADEAPGEAAPPAPPPPAVLEAAGVASHPWGQWSWQRSPPFDLDAPTTDAVVAWVRDLHTYLDQGRVDVLAGHSQAKFDEVAPVYDMTAADAAQRLTRTWSYLEAQTGWELAPFDVDDLDLRVRCGGQLIEPRTREGLAVIRQRRAIPGERWSLPIFLGRTNWEFVSGRLTILR